MNLPWSGRARSVDSLVSWNLVREEKGFRIFAFATEFERAKIFVPWIFGRVRLGFSPEFQLIKILDRNLALSSSVQEELIPFDLRHQLPKIIFPSSPLACFTSAAELALQKRSATSKNRCFSASFAARPASIKFSIT